MKKLLFVSVALAVIKSANAQYTFQSITVAGSGPSAKATTILTWGPFQTLQECNNARIRVEKANTWSEPILGGRIEAKTKAGPCSPPGGSSIGSPDVHGLSKGTSFYSTNAANEIQNWSEDQTSLRTGLDNEFQGEANSSLSTGDSDFDNARTGIDPNKPFMSINMRDENGNLKMGSEEVYFGDVLLPNDERWKSILEKEKTNELETEYTISEDEKYSEMDFYADLAEDVLHSALDIAEVTGAVAGTATAAGTIAAAVLADFAVSLVVEDGIAVYKWVSNGEIVSTKDIFKNALDRASFGATSFTKTGLEEALVKDGWLMKNNRLFGKAVSIALRTVHYGEKLYEKVKENE